MKILNIEFKASAKKSSNEYKPVVVKITTYLNEWVPTEPIIKKETTIIGQTSDPYEYAKDINSPTHGKFGKYRGLVFTNKEDAIVHATPFAEEQELHYKKIYSKGV